MDGLNRVYDRVLSGYIVTDIFIHNDFPDTYFGKELDQATYKRLKEDETFLVQTLKEIVGTFMRNGKISDTFWVHDKIFIGDEGICLLGEILTICQIVAYIDSDDLDVSKIEPNEVFKRALVKDFKGKMEEKRRLENFRRRVTTHLEFCKSDDITGIINVCNENCYTGNVVGRQDWRGEPRRSMVYNSSNRFGSNMHSGSVYTNTSNVVGGSNTNINTDTNSYTNKNILGNYTNVCENRQEKKKLTAEADREHNKNLNNSLSGNNLQKHNLYHRDTNFADRSQEEIVFVEDKLKAEGSNVRVNLSEDSNFKYICVLLITGGRQQVRVLRFNRYCGNSIKLLTTLKGTITFLNDLRCLFKDFRAQVVLKDKLRREFFAYLNFRKTEPNFRGSKIVFEFFKSLHSRAIQPLFVGLNEHYLSLLEEAISYCPIVTYAFYKNIYLLKNIDINAPRRTWKVVCNLQKLYRHMKRVKEQMTEDGDGNSGSHDESVTKKANGNDKNGSKNSSNDITNDKSNTVNENRGKYAVFRVNEKKKGDMRETSVEREYASSNFYSNETGGRTPIKNRMKNSSNKRSRKDNNCQMFFFNDDETGKSGKTSLRKNMCKTEEENQATKNMYSSFNNDRGKGVTRQSYSNLTTMDVDHKLKEYPHVHENKRHDINSCEKDYVTKATDNKGKNTVKIEKEEEKGEEDPKNKASLRRLEINKLNETCLYTTSDEDFMSNGKNAKNTNDSGDMNKTSDIHNRPLKEVITSVGPVIPYTFDEEEEDKKEDDEDEDEDDDDDDDDDDGHGEKKGKEKGKRKRKGKKKEKTKKKIKSEFEKTNENECENEHVLKVTDENISHRENYIEETRTNMVKLFKTYGGQCRIGKVHGRCEDATFQTDFPPAFGIFDGVGSWSLEGIDASKFSIGLALACQREAEKLAKNLDGYAQLSHNTIIRSKLLLKNSHLSVKNDYTEAYGSSTAIVGIIDEYTGKCGIASLGDSVCMILRREFLPENINFERESYPKFPGESFLYFNEKGRNPSIIRKIIWKTTDQKWENGAPYQLSNLPGRSEWKDLERRGYHSFVKILEKVDIDGDSPDMAISPASEILCMPGDLILLMSDGVSDNLFDEEIEAYCTFAISPEEACELGDPSLFTPAQDVAYAITNIAKRRSGDKLHHRPFLPFAGTYKEQNQVYKGNKVDDISCVAVWVVCENEESVKNFVKYPDRPSTLETDKYYNNSILYAFNEMSKLCTPSKAFVKNKDKIERVNLEYPHTMVNIIPHYQHYQGDISSGMMREHMIGATGNSNFNNNFSNSSHMVPNQGVFSFDTTETPIKYGNAKNAKDACEDLSDIILHDHENYLSDEKEDDNETGGKIKTAAGVNAEEKGNTNPKGSSSDNFNDEYINRTPEPLHGDFSSSINDGIENIENMYLKTPPLFSAESSKINQRNLRNAKTTASINEAVQKAQFLQSLNYETPIKEMKRSGTNNNSNTNAGLENAINGSSSTESIAASMTEAQFKEQMRMIHETPIKMDKRAVKNAKRKSIFAENLDSPTKTNYAPKRTKRK